MYDELVKRLKDAAKMSEALAVLLPHSEGNATAKLFNEAADTIEELSAIREEQKAQIILMAAEIEEQRPRWIPVTERLPECDYGAEVGNVVFLIGDRVYAGCYGLGGRMRDRYFRVWTDATEGCDAKDVDAWYIPTLPTPPNTNTLKPQTNYDRIISKTPEELAEWITVLQIAQTIARQDKSWWLKWLQSEELIMKASKENKE